MEEDNQKELDQSLIARDDHQPHDWPPFDPDYCSCCRQHFIHGATNVVRIAKAPETILDLNGNVMGLNKRAPAYKAVLHDSCFNRHFGRRISCDKCGGFSKILTMADGTKNQCACTCHTGSEHCSYILEPNANNKQKAYGE